MGYLVAFLFSNPRGLSWHTYTTSDREYQCGHVGQDETDMSVNNVVVQTRRQNQEQYRLEAVSRYRKVKRPPPK